MKSKLYTPAVILAGVLIAASAGGASAQAPSWPMTNAQHRTFFCGANELQNDQTMPAGYGTAMNRALDAKMKVGKTDVAGAVQQLQAQAKCDVLFAQTEGPGAALVKTSGSPSK